MKLKALHNAALVAMIGGALYLAYRSGYLRFFSPVAMPSYLPLVPNSPDPAAQKTSSVKDAISAGGNVLRAVLLPFMAKAELSNGLPAGLLDKIASTESNYRTDIVTGKTVSNKGAVGLMQIVPSSHPDAKPLDPVASVNYAAGFLKQLYSQFGTWPKAVAAYNWGPGNLSKYGLSKAPKETRNYVQRVLGVSIA